MRFPIPYIPSQSYKGGNGWGGDRSSVRPGLKHAANDLRAIPGTPVLAMDSGIVIGGPEYFYQSTYVLTVKHPLFIARYGEIAKKAEVGVGDCVVEGQVIAYVGDQKGNDMLHLEFFSGKATGNFRTETPPYWRRSDVFNGVAYLDKTRGTVTHWPDWKDSYRYDVDIDGRKFVQRMDLRDI
jgi:murein DD-endopeptidase MepM/ murein hydrolase activator NlpD